MGCHPIYTTLCSHSLYRLHNQTPTIWPSFVIACSGEIGTCSSSSTDQSCSAGRPGAGHHTAVAQMGHPSPRKEEVKIHVKQNAACAVCKTHD